MWRVGREERAGSPGTISELLFTTLSPLAMSVSNNYAANNFTLCIHFFNRPLHNDRVCEEYTTQRVEDKGTIIYTKIV